MLQFHGFLFFFFCSETAKDIHNLDLLRFVAPNSYRFSCCVPSLQRGAERHFCDAAWLYFASNFLISGPPIDAVLPLIGNTSVNFAQYRRENDTCTASRHFRSKQSFWKMGLVVKVRVRKVSVSSLLQPCPVKFSTADSDSVTGSRFSTTDSDRPPPLICGGRNWSVNSGSDVTAAWKTGPPAVRGGGWWLECLTLCCFVLCLPACRWCCHSALSAFLLPVVRCRWRLWIGRRVSSLLSPSSQNLKVAGRSDGSATRQRWGLM